MNCIVLGHGDGITVALTPESSVDQLRTAIKTHNGLSRWSKMDLYRSYNSNTETWHTVTDKDIHALGVLTEEEEIERAVAGYSVMDPSLQLGSVELNFPRAPRDRQDNIVHVLAVVPASACK
ncbi:hypothetical protein P3T76_004258 [Phytophthora citrophthora]|uniref:Crinkler effector protein N-terminal domain-containing protein n=1 Tax=Phytophthora citrophthora TaxID=4793 RepID=A0AAD9LQ60_9STRA|nr:hypothetical protein P3T76_004258 [Phytophthora citrophthora]